MFDFNLTAAALDVLGISQRRVAEVFLVLWAKRDGVVSYETISSALFDQSGDYVSRAAIQIAVAKIRKAERDKKLGFDVKARQGIGYSLKDRGFSMSEQISGLRLSTDFSSQSELLEIISNRLPSLSVKTSRLLECFCLIRSDEFQIIDVVRAYYAQHRSELTNRQFKNHLSNIRKALINAEAPIAIKYSLMSYSIQGDLQGWLRQGDLQKATSDFAKILSKNPKSRPSVPIFKHHFARSQYGYGA